MTVLTEKTPIFRPLHPMLADVEEWFTELDVSDQADVIARLEAIAYPEGEMNDDISELAMAHAKIEELEKILRGQVEAMTLDEYQTASKRTLNTSLSEHDALANYALGLAGEAGEVVDMIKKRLFHGDPGLTLHLERELGDVMFYLAAIATTLGLSLDEIALDNINKLIVRYPSGFVEGGGVR